MTAAEFIEQSTERPNSYAYFGEKPKYNADHTGELWGDTPFSKHRDSHALDRSNFNVIHKDLSERFPDVFEIEGGSHWLVGWYETVIMQLRRPGGAENTEAIDAVLAWIRKLDSYPVADENDMYDEEEKDGGVCGWCGETGHHDCHECDTKSLDNYVEYEFEGKLVCHNCGEMKNAHLPEPHEDATYP
jgi:hypothetical protein